MDVQIGGNCKYYKCRSLLACDTGGTVYETFKELGRSETASGLFKYKDAAKGKAEQTGNIIYIVDTEGESKKDKRSLVDLTTHLDDDEFNDYEMHSNTSCEPDYQATGCYPCDQRLDCLGFEAECLKGERIPCTSECAETSSLHNWVEQILENDDIFLLPDSGHYQHFDDLGNVNHYKDVNDNIRQDGLFSNDCGDNDYRFFLAKNQSNCDFSNVSAFNGQNVGEYEYDSSEKIDVASKKQHMHKRKQIYTVKDDSFTELLNDGKDLSNKTFASNGKKNKSKYNKENHRKKIQHQKRNPFENLKMNSILKGSKKLSLKRRRNNCTLPKKQPIFSNNQNFDLSSFVNSKDENFVSSQCITNNDSLEKISTNSNATDDVFMYKRSFASFHSNDELQEIGTIITLNSEFSNADYLEYVQPRERIVESDMDKLLSPTIEVEFSEILKTCKMKQIIKDNSEFTDCNGNDLGLQNIQNMNNSKPLLSANEMAERELFLKSAYAKKLGYENYFNTSNESIINEILFDSSLSYEKIKMELNLLKQLEIYSKKRALLDSSFKSVSCTLLESLNEFNRFGGFLEGIRNNEDEEDEKEEKYEYEEEGDDEDADEKGYKVNELVDTDESSDIVINEKPFNMSEVNNIQKDHTALRHSDSKRKDYDKINSNFTFNFSNKSNLLSLDFQSKYNSLDYIAKKDMTIKPPSTSLKIKIKRINDENNEYVIDDSIGQVMNINETRIITKSMKNIYRYKCYNCSAMFRTKRILKNHVSERHRGPYDTECDICHMKFRKSSAHKKHHPWCQKNVTHKCDTCSKVYCYRASLIKHLKTHRKLI